MASLATSTSSQGQGVGIVGGGFPPSGGCTSSSPGVHERAPKFSACSLLSPSEVDVSLLELNLHLYGLLKYVQFFSVLNKNIWSKILPSSVIHLFKFLQCLQVCVVFV